MKRAALAIFAVASASLAIAQQDGHIPVSVVEDWSSRRVIFSEQVPRELRGEMMAEPRFWQQLYRRHALQSPAAEEQDDDNGRDREEHHKHHRRPRSTRDWSVSLGGGSGGRISGPAKYVFDVTATPSCTADFVVTGIAAAGSATQANIIGLNNLYTNPGGTGSCSGTGPSVMFAYNVGAGQVPSLVAISLKGQKIAFSENNTVAGTSNFHILTFKTGAGNGTSATTPAVPGTGNTAVDTKIAFAGGATTGPFIDYAHDVAYVTTNGASSVVHKISGVFNGTPAEVTSGGWPATIPGNPGVSTPVFDGVSKHIFVTDGTGFIDYIDDSVNPAVVHSGSFSFASNGITAAPVVVDSTRKKVYAFAGNPNGTSAVVAQGDTSLTAASKVVVGVGAGSTNTVLEGDFNNAYYTGGAFGTAFLYVAGNDSSLAQAPALFNIGFADSTFKLNAGTANGPLALTTGLAANVIASPITEFYNSTLAKDFLFVSVSNACTLGILVGQPLGGCIRSLDITSAFPAAGAVNNVVLAATGGTGTITVDNNNSAAEASSVYFTTLSGATIVKATQSGLQ